VGKSLKKNGENLAATGFSIRLKKLLRTKRAKWRKTGRNELAKREGGAKDKKK